MAILRYRQIIEHATPGKRKITDEFTLRNGSKYDSKYLLMEFPAQVYRAGLHVYDNDDTELGFYPNHFTKLFLASLGSKYATSLAASIESGEKTVLVIAFPNGKPFATGETRVIRLTYIDGTNGNAPLLNLLNVPRYEMSLKGPLEVTPRTQVVVVPPPEYEVHPRRVKASTIRNGKQDQLTEADGYYPTETKAILDYSLPTGKLNVAFEGWYEIHPEIEEKLLFNFFFWTLTYVAFLVFVSTFGSNDAAGTIFLRSNKDIISQGILVFAGAFMGLVTNPLTHRTKIWLVIPILLSVASILQ